MLSLGWLFRPVLADRPRAGFIAIDPREGGDCWRKRRGKCKEQTLSCFISTTSSDWKMRSVPLRHCSAHNQQGPCVMPLLLKLLPLKNKRHGTWRSFDCLSSLKPHSAWRRDHSLNSSWKILNGSNLRGGRNESVRFFDKFVHHQRISKTS